MPHVQRIPAPLGCAPGTGARTDGRKARGFARSGPRRSQQASGPQSCDDGVAEIVRDRMAELPFALSAERTIVSDRPLLRRGRTGRPQGPKQVNPYLGQLGPGQFAPSRLLPSHRFQSQKWSSMSSRLADRGRGPVGRAGLPGNGSVGGSGDDLSQFVWHVVSRSWSPSTSMPRCSSGARPRFLRAKVTWCHGSCALRGGR